MKARLPLVLFLAFVVVLPACEESELPASFTNQPGGNPLVPESALLPFPSDFYLQPDPSTPTGRRVVIPAEALPEGIPAALVSAADGFSMAPAILAYLPGGFDLTSLPSPTDEGATLRDESPVFLVDADRGERIPALVELDMFTSDVERQALIIRAHRKLDPNTRYVVILRNTLRSAEGAAHVAGAAFRHLRDNLPTADPAVEAQRDAFVGVREVIEAQGLSRHEVVLAWSFHTRSEEGVTGTLLAMQQRAWAEPAGGYTITSDATDGQNRIIRGTFQAPNFLNADGLIERDATGLPLLQGRRDEEFLLAIPTSVDRARPVILYGHGFLDSLEAAGRGAVNQLCRDYGFSAIATNLGFNSAEAPAQVTILVTDWSDFDWILSLHWQRIVNFSSLVKLVQGRLAADITEDRGAGAFNPLDASNIHYSGISNGGTFGFVIASTSPAISRAAMIVGGGGLTHFLQRAVNWWQFKFLFDSKWPDPIDMQVVMSLAQGMIDPIDSINYVHRLTNNRFPGLGPMQAAVHMAVNDSQVRNVLTEWVARTADVPLITPSAKDIWGLRQITAPAPNGVTGESSAMWVYDEHVEPSPITNIPPETDNGTHGTATRLPEMQEHWAQFIEHGRMVQVCTAACDPN